MISLGIEQITEDVNQHAIVCEFFTRGENCREPAEWILYRKRDYQCCAPSYGLACNGCKALRIDIGTMLSCPGCGQVLGHSFDAYSRVERISSP